MGTKLVENIDDETWRIFAGFCKVDDKSVGEALTEVLKEFNKKRGN